MRPWRVGANECAFASPKEHPERYIKSTPCILTLKPGLHVAIGVALLSFATASGVGAALTLLLRAATTLIEVECFLARNVTLYY